MELSDKQLNKFQELYQKNFGEDLDKQEAYEKAINLVRLMELVYKPITKEGYKKLQNRKKEIKKL